MAPIDEREREEIASFLQKGAWFGGLPAALQERILSRSVLRSFEKGAVVSAAGVAPEGLSVLLEGRIEFLRYVGADEEILLHVAEPGFWFGEIGILAGREAATTILAQTPVRTLLFPRAEFERTVEEEPRFFRPMARLAIDRYVAVLGFLAQAGGLSAEARLRHRLADLVEMRRVEGDVEGDVVLGTSQAALARVLGVSRQTLNALLGKLESEGLVEVGFQCIRVRAPARLGAKASPPVVDTAGEG